MVTTVQVNSWSLIGHAEGLSEVGTLKASDYRTPVVGLADALRIGRERYETGVSLAPWCTPMGVAAGRPFGRRRSETSSGTGGGVAPVMVVYGEAGIGKTRVAAEIGRGVR